MTRHEVQGLVIAAVGDLPYVTRIDYVVDAGGEGVVVMCGDKYWATEHTQLATMTADEIRTHFLAAYHKSFPQAVDAEGDAACL